MNKDVTKRLVYIDPRALTRTRKFITLMGFTGLIQRRVIGSWNINIV